MTLPATESEKIPEPIIEPPMIRQIETVIGYILRYGVLLAISFVLLGTTISFVHHPEFRAQPHPFKDFSHLVTIYPTTLGGTWDFIVHWLGRGFVIGGLLILLLTPVLTVTASIFAFAKMRDRIFAFITSATLATLMFSFYLGSLQHSDQAPTPPAATAPAETPASR